MGAEEAIRTLLPSEFSSTFVYESYVSNLAKVFQPLTQARLSKRRNVQSQQKIREGNETSYCMYQTFPIFFPC